MPDKMPDTTLPHWQLETIFPGLDSEAYRTAKQKLKDDLESLQTLMDDNAVGTRANAEVTPEVVKLYETLLTRFNALADDITTLYAYLRGFTTTNAFNDEAQAEASVLKPLLSKLNTLGTRFTAWTGSSDVAALIKASSLAQAHRFDLEKDVLLARHQMVDEAEALAAQLDTTGGGAWAKLHGDLSSRTTLYRELPGLEAKDWNLSELKNLQHDKNSELRKAAFEAELELLAQNEVAYAAAMNSIKGQVNSLCERRGWGSALEVSLVYNNLTQESLTAMQTACKEAFPDFRRYLKAKAKLLGKDTLDWYDLNAPVSEQPQTFTWEEAKVFVVDTFRNYSDDLAGFAERAFGEAWCDVPPRKGKRGGAFCMKVPGRKESRVLLNYGHTLDDVFTLAHELGHAYHNEQIYRAGRTAIQRNTPMPLAETASIFCETIVVNAMLREADDAATLAILEQDLLGATGLVVDIHSRFILESTVFDKREERELSIAELKDIMLNAQAETYGEGLNEHHALMWAQKGHYYSSTLSFYNYPYTFGYLFGLGLYARFEREPEGFHARYDDLLSSTGMDDAVSLAKRFEIDIEDVDFWRSSLSIAKERVATFERLVDSLA